jgi:hypothetical protein
MEPLNQEITDGLGHFKRSFVLRPGMIEGPERVMHHEDRRSFDWHSLSFWNCREGLVVPQDALVIVQ